MQQAVDRFVSRAAEEDFIAVVDDDGEHGARWLLEQARQLAGAPTGPGAGGTLMVQAQNSWRTVAAALTAGLGDGVLALVNRHTTRSEFAAAVEDVRPDSVVVEPSAWDEWGVADLLRTGPADEAFDGWAAARAAETLGAGRWGGGAVIGMTSGSTGRAKAVIQSGESLRYACANTIAANGLQPGDPVAAIVPLSSIAAFSFGVALSMQLEGPLVLAGRWDPSAVLTRMNAARARWVMCVPTMALQLAGAATAAGAPSTLRTLTVGGGPMQLDMLRDAERALDTTILRVFGMSECLGHTSPSPDDPVEVRLGRDGRPFPGTDVRAVDENDIPVAVGEVGRAQVRGPSLFLGYAEHGRVRAPDLTPDGWFATGDLVALHPDGTISIRGREKDMIIRGGRNIDVMEVETAVQEHPSVEQACVVPVADAVLGERIAVLVVTSPGSEVDLADLTRHLGDRGLSRTKWPEFVFEVPALPHTAVGKLSRPAARAMAAELRQTGEVLA